MYKIDSPHATEFIDGAEIEASLDYAEANKDNVDLINSLIDKAAQCKGLTHREAAVLLLCHDQKLRERIHNLARDVKKRIYGNRIVLFAPLYLSNYCVNGCVYCPYHAKNHQLPRKKLTQEEVRNETLALQDLGHKRLALESGEHPIETPIEYILDCINTIYSTHHKHGAIRRVNVNIAATTVENYKKLKEAGIGTYILFQETYNKENYERLHPSGPKSDYAWHTEAMDRAQTAGIDDVGCGVLFGLSPYAYDFVGILMHAEHLDARFGVGLHTISVPRIRPADDIDPHTFPNAVADDDFLHIIACIRLAVPYTGMIISTRESPHVRGEALHLGISQISGGSRTSVGGYAEPDEETAQFETNDTRSLDQVIAWLIDLGYIPSFCTACYRAGRTGDRFMSICKSGEIHNCCTPNAIMTLKEYLVDYASPETRRKGDALIQQSLQLINNVKIRQTTEQHLADIESGERDFRF
ncbi:MAG: [FeFe] hydrogenase H-cluster radical SAM maturase HydG [Prevotella sp.]